MDEIIQGDSYRVFVPIEDHDLLKSVTVDENGDYIVQGVMSSDETDEEDDSISPEGMDCSYFLEKGWVKYEHGKNPDQFIGEPLEVKVGRFDHPTLLKSVNGVFVKARLFANRKLTQQAIEAMNDLQKSHTKRRMGWSIEGNAVKRHPKTGKILKSILRNVVLTMNPVNTCTWAELAKSFAKEHELTIDMDEPFEKAMDIAGAQAIAKQSLEGEPKEKDPQQEWIDAFRSVVKKALVEKSFRNEFVSSPDNAETLTFTELLTKGFDYEEADSIASYIAERHTLLKSLVINFGGENMSNEAKNTLAGLLDADLEELQKSIELDEQEDNFEDEEENEELEKGIDSEEEGEESASEDDDSEEEGDDEEGEEDDEEMSKSFQTDLTKSIAEDHGQAFEVSDFLTSLTEEIGFSLEGLEKSLMKQSKQTNALLSAVVKMGDALQKSFDKIESLEESNQELQKSLNAVLTTPVGRKGVVSQREVQTLTKSVESDIQPRNLTKSQITDVLLKSFEDGDIGGSVITRYEGGVPLNQLNLPAHLQKQFGLTK